MPLAHSRQKLAYGRVKETYAADFGRPDGMSGAAFGTTDYARNCMNELAFVTKKYIFHSLIPLTDGRFGSRIPGGSQSFGRRGVDP
jgi:hypothetical protein